jgi:hypothetical protein
MASSPVIGYVTAPSGLGTANLTKLTVKLEQAKLEYTAMGTTGGWKTTVPGGPQFASGSFEGICMGDFTPYATAAVTIASTDIGFSASCIILDVELDKSSDGLVTCKGTFQSTGVVTT